MMTSAQTLARIGRWMKVSTNTCGSRLGAGSWELGAGGFRRRALGLCRDRCAVGEVLPAGDDDPLTGLDALEHGIGVTDNRPDLDRALFRDEPAAGPRRRDEHEQLAGDAEH